MNITRRNLTIGGLSLLAGSSMSTLGRAEFGAFLGIGEGIEDFGLATDAYIFGYPLVTMEMTRRVITNVAAPEGRGRRWARSSSCGSIPTRRSGTSPRRMPTRSTPLHFSMSARNRGC